MEGDVAPPRPRGRAPGGYRSVAPSPPGPGDPPNPGREGEGRSPESERGIWTGGGGGGGSRPPGREWTPDGAGGGGWTSGGGEGSGSYAGDPLGFPEPPFPFNQPELPPQGPAKGAGGSYPGNLNRFLRASWPIRVAIGFIEYVNPFKIRTRFKLVFVELILRLAQDNHTESEIVDRLHLTTSAQF